MSEPQVAWSIAYDHDPETKSWRQMSPLMERHVDLKPDESDETRTLKALVCSVLSWKRVSVMLREAYVEHNMLREETEALRTQLAAITRSRNDLAAKIGDPTIKKQKAKS